MKDTTPVILGIDPATKCGIAVLSVLNGSLVGYDTKTFKSSLRGRTGGAAHLLHTWIGRYNIQAYGMEKPNRFYNAIACGWSIMAVADWLMMQAGINPPVVVTATQLKKFATGKGNATKEDMVKAVKKLYPEFNGDDNAADAVMIALYALHEYKDKHAAT